MSNFRPQSRIVPRRLEACWQSRGPCAVLLYPMALVFCVLVALRRTAYRVGLLPSRHPGVPVVVVGNITSGGSGKTPFVAWLCGWLRERGHRPGVVLRGYRGESGAWPLRVTARTSPRLAGEEAVLLARLAGVPVVAGPSRIDDCRELLKHDDIDVIVCDDGLQHYALRRDFEIVLHDDRGHNGWCLPAGPLREPRRRLRTVDLVIAGEDDAHGLQRLPGQVRRIQDPSVGRDLLDLGLKRLLVVCGIARPWRFFDMLSRHGLEFDRRVFPDHHDFRREDFPDTGYDAILMTEKDAIKCEPVADDRFWWVSLVLTPAPELCAALSSRLEPVLKAHG